MKLYMGIISIAMALVLGIVPMFTDCQSQGRSIELANGKTIPMKCHWTGIAEIGVAIPLALVGVSQIFGKKKETVNYSGTFGVVLGALAIAFPTALIGVCANPEMTCNMIMRPSLITAGVIAIGASAIAMVTYRNKVDLSA